MNKIKSIIQDCKNYFYRKYIKVINERDFVYELITYSVCLSPIFVIFLIYNTNPAQKVIESNSENICKNESNIIFFNDTVPFRKDINERIIYEISKYVRNRRFEAIYERAKKHESEIKAICKANQVSEDLFYIAIVESELLDSVSPSGAIGIFQIMPITANHYSKSKYDRRKLHDKINSCLIACKIYKDCYHMYGNPYDALAAYNCGLYGYNIIRKRQGNKSYWNLKLCNETYSYVARIIAAKIIYEEMKKQDSINSIYGRPYFNS